MENATPARIPCSASLSASSPEQLAQIARVTEQILELPQIDIVTEHVFHGGMYARTIRIPAGCVLAGALIKVSTLLVVHGDAKVLTGDGAADLSGFSVLAGSAFRKQVFVALSPVEMTMIFPTQAKTVEEAERKFTDEYEKLMSRNSANDTVLVTGE